MRDEKYDILIVGAGISGTVMAEQFAFIFNKRRLVIGKRNHIGDNCYDFYNDERILVQLYGPHFFHTNYEDVWDYMLVSLHNGTPMNIEFLVILTEGLLNEKPFFKSTSI